MLRVEDWDPRSANVHDNANVVGSITIGIEEESRLLDALERLQDLGTYDLTDRNYDGTWTFQFTGPMKMFATGKDMPPELQDFLTIVIDAADAQGCGPVSERLNRFLDLRDENLGEAYIAITRGELEGFVSRETAMAIAKDAARDEMFSRARDAMMMLYERLLRQEGYGDIVDAWGRRRPCDAEHLRGCRSRRMP